jgi:hypothetical protein
MSHLALNKVTPLSKTLALAFFIALPIAAFYFGRWYEDTMMFTETFSYMHTPARTTQHVSAPVAADTDFPTPPGPVPKQMPDTFMLQQANATVSPPASPASVPTQTPNVPVDTFGNSAI